MVILAPLTTQKSLLLAHAAIISSTITIGCTKPSGFKKKYLRDKIQNILTPFKYDTLDSTFDIYKVVFFENSRFRYKNYFFFKIQTFIESKLK
jgi:hypothetical protein